MRKLKFFYVYVDQNYKLKFYASIESYMNLKEGTKVYVATSNEYPTSLFVIRGKKPSPQIGHLVKESNHEKSERKYIEIKKLLKEMKIEKLNSYQCYKYEDQKYKGIRIDFKTPVK